MAIQQTLTDYGMKGMNLAHKAVLKVSGGRLGGTIGSMPVVQLHHTGRTSGKARTTMLTAPIVDDGSYVLVASKGGDDRDPQWYLNLVADHDCELTVGDETLAYTARVASEDEKNDMWPRIVEAYKGYAGYQERTDRNIPVVICDPR